MEKKLIDFSCRHDSWIRNPDGSFMRMDEPFFKAEKIAEDTWQVLSSGDYSYVIAGTEKAVAVDTGYGAGNIREFMQSLTEKPLSSVINTHDHFDHTANNWYFDRAYMTEETAKRATRPSPSFWGIPFQTRYEKVIIEDGDSFDLGGRTLTVFGIPDHAKGSIALLDRKERILFAGDEFMPGKKRFSGSVRQFYEKFMKIYEYRNEIDQVCAGCGILDPGILDQHKKLMEMYLGGEKGVIPEPDHFRMPLILGPDGKAAYDRKFPHPEDIPAPVPAGEQKYFREIRQDDFSIVYDIRNQEEMCG